MCALTKQCQNGSTRPSSSGLFFALSNSGQHRNTASVILTLALMLAGFRLHALSGKDKKTKTEPSQRQCSQREKKERLQLQCLSNAERRNSLQQCRVTGLHTASAQIWLLVQLSNRTFLQAPPITKNVKVHKSTANTKIQCRYSPASSSLSYASDIIQSTLRPRVFLHYNNSRIRVLHSFGNYSTTLMHRKRAQRKKHFVKRNKIVAKDQRTTFLSSQTQNKQTNRNKPEKTKTESCRLRRG